ncbi:MAG: cysteine hydrolase [Sedimentisphaerales bacterium]|nr:cysteine hydrolase [Sedimentisphaerales bacterium]
MIRQLMKARRKQVLIDVNTQKDFFLDEGKARVGNRRRILIHIRRMMALARAKKIPVISISEVHPEDNGGWEYCIDGTDGSQKIHYTLLSNRASFAADTNTDLPVDLLRRYRQIILHKRCMDPFDEPRIDRLLSEIRANEFVLIGACVEGAIEATALGLLQRGKRVSVVVDAIGAQDKQKAKHSLRKIAAKGARLIETRKLAGTSHLKSVGILKTDLIEDGAHTDMADITVE